MKIHPVVAAGFTLVITALVSACTSESSGTPLPSNSASGNGSTTSRPPIKSRLLPPRSRDIDLIGADPCKALTSDQAKQLDFDAGYERSPSKGTDIVTGAPDCSYSSTSRGVGALIATVTTEGAETWLTSPDRKTTKPPKVVTVDGFPALQITVLPNDDRPNKCYLIIDVHDGQYLSIFSSDIAGGPTGSAAYCAEATKIAGMAIQTIESGK